MSNKNRNPRNTALNIFSENNKSLMATREGHAYKRYHARKNHAKKNNIPFDISLEYVISIITDTCPVLGVPLSWCENGDRSETSPSLDKIIDDLGYVEGNVCWISYRANRIKNNGTAEEHRAIYEWMSSKK